MSNSETFIGYDTPRTTGIQPTFTDLERKAPIRVLINLRACGPNHPLELER
jgi:hypothetical protein